MSPAYEAFGQGEPLLVLSGYGVRSSALLPVVAPLAEHFRCITFDYPLSGGPLPWSPLTVPAMAAAAVEVLDRAGHASAHVLGISLGGLVAQELAIRFPERVRGLVLAATSPGGPQAQVPDPWTLLAGFTAIHGSFVGTSVGSRALLAQTVAASLHDTSRRLYRIQAPTLVVHGERDVLVPAGNAHLLHRGIPGSVLELVPGAGHLYFFEEADAAADRVLRWLRDAPPARGGPPDAARRAAERVGRAFALQVGCLRLGYGHAVRAAAWLEQPSGRSRRYRSTNGFPSERLVRRGLGWFGVSPAFRG